MIHETFALREEGSADYARMITYIWDYSEAVAVDQRPMVLILPGGCYRFTSDREAEAIALNLMASGVNAAVLRYSVAPAQFPTALYETARAVLTIREHAQEWHVDPEKIVVCGFSAGGHLAASYGVFWNQSWLHEAVGCQAEALRIAGLLLGYPVITTEEGHCHQESVENIMGSRYGDEPFREYLSLEKQVNADTPKTFIWNTGEDETVPPENSLYWVTSLMKQGIPVEYHLYEKGVHGLSLANEITDNPAHQRVQKECQSWFPLALTWLKNV